jgi:hypothetical protein
MPPGRADPPLTRDPAGRGSGLGTAEPLLDPTRLDPLEARLGFGQLFSFPGQPGRPGYGLFFLFFLFFLHIYTYTHNLDLCHMGGSLNI